ncbi:MAG: nucleoside 2-deoxyribosyltransferase, partial [Thermoplasmataceae archaeon]
MFAPDWERRCAVLCDALAQRGFRALVPESSPGMTSKVIYEANREKIRSADWILANLQRFRGAEPDSGTVFEVGFAVALGKPVYAYNASGSYAARVAQAQGNLDSDPAK